MQSAPYQRRKRLSNPQHAKGQRVASQSDEHKANDVVGGRRESSDELLRMVAGLRLVAEPGMYELLVVEADGRANLTVKRVKRMTAAEARRAWKWVLAVLGYRTAEERRLARKVAA